MSALANFVEHCTSTQYLIGSVKQDKKLNIKLGRLEGKNKTIFEDNIDDDILDM